VVNDLVERPNISERARVRDVSRVIYRQLSVAFFCRLTKTSLPNIGRMFGANHHQDGH
jgi:chromosomal replication initiation ATPase DnaA